MLRENLPIPPHFDPERAGSLWQVDYATRFREARAWAEQHAIPPAAEDAYRTALVLIDVQNTFCLPQGELFVAGRSGNGAVEDNIRLCRFLYQNLHRITHIVATLDTHLPLQIFHPTLLVDAEGKHPDPYTMVTAAEVEAGKWRFNPAAAQALGLTPETAQRYLLHYLRTLEANGKYTHTIWPFHAMLGGVGHALVPIVEEAIFFHSAARYAQPEYLIKGNHPLTEHYSALKPEVNADLEGQPLVQPNERLVELVETFDAVIITGQAKSHCVAWTVQDLLDGLRARGKGNLTRKIYLLEDTTSPVVVPGADFTEAAEEAYARFAAAGMHRVTTAQPMVTWPDWGQTEPSHAA